MFQLTEAETEELLRFQIGISKPGRGGRRYRPFAFTEQGGVAMLSSVLKSRRAVPVNVEIMRAFVRLRQLLATHAELALKLDALEKKYDAQFRVVFDPFENLWLPFPRRRNRRSVFARRTRRTDPHRRAVCNNRINHLQHRQL